MYNTLNRNQNRKLMLTAIIILIITLIMPTVYANEQNDTNDNVQLAEIVYLTDTEYIQENIDKYDKNNDIVNHQILVVYTTNPSIDLDKVIEDASEIVEDTFDNIYLKKIDNTHTSEVEGYFCNEDGEVLPLDIENKDHIVEDEIETIKPDEVAKDVESIVNDLIESQNSDNIIAAAAASACVINVSLSTSYDSDKNRVKATATKSGSAPNPATLTLKLQNKLTGGIFETKKSKSINFRTNASGSVKYGTTKTRIWRAQLTGKLGSANVNYSTYNFVYNKKCKRYPSYTEYYSGKTMLIPSTNYLKTSSISWTTSDRNNYIKWFKDKYPKSKNRDWGNFHIHHVRPRAWGGSNAYANLIPIPASTHTGTVTPWWSSY